MTISRLRPVGLFLIAFLLAVSCKTAPRRTPERRAAAAGVYESDVGGSGAAVPTRLPAAARIVAIGDLHGDLTAAERVLHLAGVMDADGGWSGGKTVVVQTGDILDRGGDEAEVLALLERLGGEARRAGGAVVALNGNHELLNVEGDLRYVTAEGMGDFASYAAGDADPAAGRLAAFRPGGPLARRLARRNVVVVVGDTVFVHGGLLPEHVAYGLERMNRELRSWMRGGLGSLPVLFRGRESPVWMRDYSDAPDAGDCAHLEQALESVPASRMVMGHTVQEGGIAHVCGRRGWLVDTGMSAAYGGPVQALEIDAGGEVAVLAEPTAVPAVLKR